MSYADQLLANMIIELGKFEKSSNYTFDKGLDLLPRYEEQAPITASSIPLMDAIIVNAVDYDQDKNILKEKKRAIEVGDIIEEAHPSDETVTMADAPYNNGIVENQNQQQERILNSVHHTPTGFPFHTIATIEAMKTLAKIAENLEKRNLRKEAMEVDKVLGFLDQLQKSAVDMGAPVAPIANQGKDQPVPFTDDDFRRVPKLPGGPMSPEQIEKAKQKIPMSPFPKMPGGPMSPQQIEKAKQKIPMGPMSDLDVEKVIIQRENEKAARDAANQAAGISDNNKVPAKAPAVAPAAPPAAPAASKAPSISPSDAHEAAGLSDKPAPKAAPVKPTISDAAEAAGLTDTAREALKDKAKDIVEDKAPGVWGWVKKLWQSKGGKAGIIGTAIAGVAAGIYYLWNRHSNSISGHIGKLKDHNNPQVQQLAEQLETQMESLEAELKSGSMGPEVADHITAIENLANQINNVISDNDPLKVESKALVKQVHIFAIESSGQVKKHIEDQGGTVGPITEKERITGIQEFFNRRFNSGLELTGQVDESTKSLIIDFIDKLKAKLRVSPRLLTFENVMRGGTEQKLESIYDVMQNPQRYVTQQ